MRWYIFIILPILQTLISYITFTKNDKWWEHWGTYCYYATPYQWMGALTASLMWYFLIYVVLITTLNIKNFTKGDKLYLKYGWLLIPLYIVFGL